MAETIATPGLTPQQWDDKFFREYVRANRFRRYMGTTENSIIHIKEDLTRKKGDKITFANVRKLRGPGVTGRTVLEGNEEELDTRSMVVQVDTLRNAVVVTDHDEQLSAIGLRDAARGALKDWALDRMKSDIITALMSINGVAYGSASEGQKDAWLADNADRVLFGNARSNNSGNDHSVSLANIDNSADKMTAATVSLAKRMATNADPAIRPIRINDDEEWFVMFCNKWAFRDLSQDSAMQQANRDARPRAVMENPIFTGGSLVWDGVIIREIPEIPVIAGVGDGGIDVAPNFLCGAQAVGVGWARRLRSTTDVRDYNFRKGVGVQEMRGIEKLLFGKGADDLDDLVQHGVVTVYTAGVADA